MKIQVTAPQEEDSGTCAIRVERFRNLRYWMMMDAITRTEDDSGNWAIEGRFS